MAERPDAVVGMVVHVVAFDGVVADTLPVRGAAFCAAMRAVAATAPEAFAAVYGDTAVLESVVAEQLPGRTFAETAQLLLPPTLRQADPTLTTLVALEAESVWRGRCAQGIGLHAEVVAQLVTAQAQGARIVLRADSSRREVEAMLQQAGIESLAALVRCADDGAPRAAAGAPSVVAPSVVAPSATTHSSTGQSYRAIAQRLALWPPIIRCTIHEAGRYATAIASATLRT